MTALSEEGRYIVPEAMHAELCRIFHSGFCSEEDTMKTIKDTYDNADYLIDTHTAVAYKVLNDYRQTTGDDSISVVVSTASPFKFCETVLKALGHDYSNKGAILVDTLSEVTGNTIPKPLVDLKFATPRFNDSVSVSAMKEAVIDFIGRR